MYRALVKLFLLLIPLIVFIAALEAQQAAPSAVPQAVSTQLPPSDHLNAALPKWIKLNGEYRMRLEGITGASFRDDASDAYSLSRVRMNLTSRLDRG
jgi:hypothetical protein